MRGSSARRRSIGSVPSAAMRRVREQGFGSSEQTPPSSLSRHRGPHSSPSPSGSRTRTSGMVPIARPFCRRASLSRFSGVNTERAAGSFPRRIGGSEPRSCVSSLILGGEGRSRTHQRQVHCLSTDLKSADATGQPSSPYSVPCYPCMNATLAFWRRPHDHACENKAAPSKRGFGSCLHARWRSRSGAEAATRKSPTRLVISS